MISLYCSGDDRLMRKALLDFYRSRTPIGLTQSRYPTNRLQIIPTFSLFWVSMVHDYWMHRRDDEFVRQFLPAINEVLMWYKDRIDKKTGMLGPMQWWNFIDWDNFNGWGIALVPKMAIQQLSPCRLPILFRKALSFFQLLEKLERQKNLLVFLMV